MSWRVAFDLRWVNRDPGGVTTYSLNLLSHLVRAMGPGSESVNGLPESDSPEFRFLAIANPGAEQLVSRYLSENIPGLEFVTVDYHPFTPRSFLSLAGLLRKRNVDLYHSPYYLGLLTPSRVKKVVTVHDLMSYLFPQRCPEARSVRYFPAFAAVLRRSLANADAVLADSEATARDVRSAFPAVAEKVRVVYIAVNSVYFERLGASDLDGIRAKFGVAGPLILYVGRRDPNRNLVPLIRAVALLSERGQNPYLVAAGRPDDRYPEPDIAVRELGLAERVRFPGFVELPDLQALYQAADVLVLPSSYEGFGLPPLEAMASGTPVVCSDRASIPEVVGAAAVFVEPEDPVSIADGIERVLTDGKLRSELVEKGRKRALMFSWEAAAQQVLGIYRQLLAKATLDSEPRSAS